MNRFELAENTLSKSAPSRVIYATASVGRPDGGVPVIQRSDAAGGLITGGGPNKCGGVEECLGNDRHGVGVLGPGPSHGRPAPGGPTTRDVVLARHHGRARGHRGRGAASGRGARPAGRSGRCGLDPLEATPGPAPHRRGSGLPARRTAGRRARHAEPATYLGVLRVDMAELEAQACASYWSVPMSSAAMLCAPLAVARLIALTAARRAAATPAPAVRGPAATAGSGAHENARPGGRKPPGRAFSRLTGPAFS